MAAQSACAGKRIGISGAGVGGTAFALALEQACKARGISPMPIIKIFERDASPSARENLGYSFSLKQEGRSGPGGLQVEL
jgi:2-polyprenyl-6-methoxyphenol hydroxylase-like FAD-dependent oxidoreductase